MFFRKLDVLWRWDFLILVLTLFLVNAFIFDPLFIPREDAKTKLTLFHFFYNSFLYDKQWPLWMPQHTLGLPASMWQWVGLTPTHVVAIILGASIGVTDIIWLFKACHLVNQLFFLTGLYLLADYLRVSRLARFMTAFSGGIFHWWFIDMDLKFHTIYFLPWVLCLLMIAVKDRQAWRLWAAGILTIAWVMGNCLYYFPLWAMLLAIFALALWWPQRQGFQVSFLKPLSLFFLGALGVSMVAFYFQFHNFFEATANAQRAGGNSHNSLANFMTYGPVYQGTWENLIHYFVLGSFQEYYLPTVIFVFALWAFFFVNQAMANALKLCLLALLAFSFKGWFSYAMYFLPGMPLFHDLGNTVSVVKIFIVLLSGYGISDFLNGNGQVLWRRLALLIAGLLLFIDGLGITRQWVMASFAKGHDPLFNILQHPGGLRWALLAAVGTFALIALMLKQRLGKGFFVAHVLLIVWFLFDVAVYAKGYRDGLEKFYWKKEARLLWDAAPLPYQASRTAQPMSERSSQLWPYLLKDTLYAPVFSIMDFDPCWPEARVDFTTKRVFDLSNTGEIPSEIIACGHPKLRVVAYARHVANRQQAEALIRAEGLNPKAVIIEGAPKVNFPAIAGTPEQAKIVVKRYGANFLELEVQSAGGWLVYADAFAFGWQARLNGKPVKIYPADLAFKAVYLPQGEGKLSFEYRPWVDILANSWWILLSFFLVVVFLRITLKAMFQPFKRVSP